MHNIDRSQGLQLGLVWSAFYMMGADSMQMLHLTALRNLTYHVKTVKPQHP